jgi:uncharacterized membrane protein YgdD (TMEM256/DUF423 family)
VIPREANEKAGSLLKWVFAASAAAGLTGASGIILAGIGAHGVSDPRLQTAANFMLLHAAVGLAVCGLSVAAPRRGIWFLGAVGLFLTGSLLFGGDLTARALAGSRLFPMAAPIGATLLLLGWVYVGVAALAVLWKAHDGKPDQDLDE